MTVIPFSTSARRRRPEGATVLREVVAVFAVALFATLFVLSNDATADWEPDVPNAGPSAPPIARPSAATLIGRPTRITDGDTFRFGETSIRLHGIDAPEMSTRWGDGARTHLASLIGAGQVRCDDTGQRSYRRVVAVCQAADGRDLAASMVEAGWADDAPRFSGGRYAALSARDAALTQPEAGRPSGSPQAVTVRSHGVWQATTTQPGRDRCLTRTNQERTPSARFGGDGCHEVSRARVGGVGDVERVRLRRVRPLRHGRLSGGACDLAWIGWPDGTAFPSPDDAKLWTPPVSAAPALERGVGRSATWAV